MYRKVSRYSLEKYDTFLYTDINKNKEKNREENSSAPAMAVAFFFEKQGGITCYPLKN